MQETVFEISVWSQGAVQVQQRIEHGNTIGKKILEVTAGAVKDLIQATDQGEHGENRLDQHAFVPEAAWKELEVGRNTAC